VNDLIGGAMGGSCVDQPVTARPSDGGVGEHKPFGLFT
jgi:hypothetical protein